MTSWRNILSVLVVMTMFVPVAMSAPEQNNGVRIKELARIQGVRANSLIGYGLVVGLAGSGDSSRSKSTLQSVSNALIQFGVSVTQDDVNSRNVAAVVLTAEIPAFAQSGDRLNLNVSSLGDARSLVGGTLLMAPLRGADNKVYALAQGQISVGGFKYDLNGNVLQKNHPTVGMIPDGAIVEAPVEAQLLSSANKLTLIINEPDFTTASRMESAINEKFNQPVAQAVHAGKIDINYDLSLGSIVSFITLVEGVVVAPDTLARVVVNERTGTVVSGGEVRIDDVTISHGEIKVVISTDFAVSQPSFIGRNQGGNLSTVVVPETQIEVKESVAQAVDLPSGTTIADLISALRSIKTSTRDIITILQAIKAANALHAQIIIQ